MRRYWIDDVNINDIRFYNEKAKQEFGIIQCREEFLGKESISNFLLDNGLNVKGIHPIKSIEIKKQFSRSNLFSFLGKIKKNLYYSNRLKEQNYQSKMA